jgi:DNA-binding MarR family transcriptional regulator
MSDSKAGANQLFLKEEALRRGMELLFRAQRDLAGDVDALLARLGLGRAHHRVIFFVGRHPRITVGELLSVLQITKQSLSRVLADLVRAGYIDQRPGPSDRRQRRLALTDAGRAVERQLYDVQHRRLADAYRRAGAEAVDGFHTVLRGMIDSAEAVPAPEGSAAPPPPAWRTG